MNDRVNIFTFQPLETPPDTAGPVLVRIMPAGKFTGRGHEGVFDAGDRAAMQAIVDRSRTGTTDLMVDYDHQSIGVVFDRNGQRAEAAGWMKDFEVKDDGIYAHVEWTAAAAQKIRDRAYRYLSPFFYSNPKTGAVTRIVNAGLVNVPALDLPVATAASARFPNDPETKESDMKSIAKAMGLADDASEAAILAAITGNHAKIAMAAGLKSDATVDAVVAATSAAVGGLGKVALAAGLKADAVADDIATAFAGGKAGEFVPVSMFNDLSAQLKTLQTNVAGKDVEEAVATAMSEGKVTPASETWARGYATKDLEGFKAFAATAPVLTKTQLGDAKQVEGSGELDANAMAAKARAYQDEQASAGITVSIIEAVDHVAAQAKAGK